MRPEGDMACQEQVGVKGPVLLGLSVLAPVDTSLPGLPGCAKHIGLHKAQSWSKDGVQGTRPCFLQDPRSVCQRLRQAGHAGKIGMVVEVAWCAESGLSFQP